MAQENLQYTIPASADETDGRQVNLTLTYDENAQNDDGSYTITDASGTYSQINSDGIIITTANVTGVTGQVEGAGDNHLFINQGQIVDSQGINFTIDNNSISNDGNGGVNFWNTGDEESPDYREFPNNASSNSATNVAESPAPCFVTGTLIRIARDGAETDVAVEHLRVGDLAVTVSGRRRPVRWIGHRHIDGRGRPLPHDHQPVRIRAGAFGTGPDGQPRPARDLRLSHGHTVLVGADADGAGGHLVPVMCLVNGTSVAREPATGVTYWHVELDGHDVLLAENLPADSYLDWGDRPFFDEASDHALHNPDFVVPGEGARCRPVAIDGPVVEAERRRLDALFAAELVAQAAWDAPGEPAWLAA